jgi:hypothetical protein
VIIGHGIILIWERRRRAEAILDGPRMFSVQQIINPRVRSRSRRDQECTKWLSKTVIGEQDVELASRLCPLEPVYAQERGVTAI